jgi:flagellar basal-body rod protein FlgB
MSRAIILRDQVALKPASTNSGHIAPRSGFRPQEAEGEGGNPSGVVSIEQQMIKLSDTQIHYQTATNLYQKAVAMFRTALGTRS